MEQEILKRLEEQRSQIEAIYVSVEKTRKYFFWTGVVTIVVIVLPLIVIPFLLPAALAGLTGAGLGL